MVERQRAQRPDPERRAVVGVRAAAELVEARLVTDDTAGDPLEAALGEHLGETAELGAIELGVAAAPQVDVARDDALLVGIAVAEDLGAQLTFVAVADERSRRRVELVHGGRDPRHVSRAGVQRGAAVEVHHVRAGA